MEFTVFTAAGGFREFLGDSSYTIGEHNGVLYVWEGPTGQVISYGPAAWASVQEWKREEGEDRVEKPRPLGRRRRVAEDVSS